MGAVALTVGTERNALAWLARSATTWAEHQHNKDTGINEPTGRVTATVDVQIAVRDFELLDVLGAHLSTHEDLHIHGVSWQVDSDNPGWARVRAAAIHAAIDKGRDYAAALGVSLVEVLHVADAGLLDGNAPLRAGRPLGGAVSRRFARGHTLTGPRTPRTHGHDRCPASSHRGVLNRELIAATGGADGRLSDRSGPHASRASLWRASVRQRRRVVASRPDLSARTQDCTVTSHSSEAEGYR